jgi:hypothetical protein
LGRSQIVAGWRSSAGCFAVLVVCFVVGLVVFLVVDSMLHVWVFVVVVFVELIKLLLHSVYLFY